MKQIILDVLEDMERKEEVKVLYACEAGSRAWGFASSDSDFDVRFIYLHPPDWYLSINIERKRDVIERPVEEQLDFSGWDLHKALRLFQRSNPPLLEWLDSPIIYAEPYSVVARMRELAPYCYSPIACMYHYFKMAKGNYKEYLRGETVWLKKYLYVLRPVLAVIWLERDLGVVPTRFQQLVERTVKSQELLEAIDTLLKAKISGMELDYGPRIPAINEFLDEELSRMEGEDFEKRVNKCSTERLDELFRRALEEVWP